MSGVIGMPTVSVVPESARGALIALLRSGDVYVEETEVHPTKVVSHFYREGGNDPIAMVVIESHNAGVMTNLAKRAILGDESAQAEFEHGAVAAGAH